MPGTFAACFYEVLSISIVFINVFVVIWEDLVEELGLVHIGLVL